MNALLPMIATFAGLSAVEALPVAAAAALPPMTLTQALKTATGKTADDARAFLATIDKAMPEYPKVKGLGEGAGVVILVSASTSAASAVHSAWRQKSPGSPRLAVPASQRLTRASAARR